jgi:uncharacterized protein (TIGR03083 family)
MTTTGFPNLATAAYLRQLRDEGDRLATSAEPVPLDQAVPACPGWTIRSLLRHVGYVHRWATRYVSERQTQMMPRLDEAAIVRQDIPDEELLGWFRTGHAALLQAMDAAGPELRCWTFLPGAVSPLAFWARRQAHETTVHRVDVQQAAAAAAPGQDVDPVPAELAADGIDELLMGFARRNARRGPLADPPRGLFVQAAGGYQWVARMGPEQAAVDRGWPGPAAGPADCTVTGPAAELYLLLWNRGDLADLPGLRLTGDPEVLEQWRHGVRVTWR